MDEERPIDQFVGFLKLLGTLVVIVLSGVGLVVALSWYLSPEQPQEIGVVSSGAVKRLPAYQPEALEPVDAADPLDAELAEVQGEYQQAKVALESALEARDGAPVELQEELGVVEGAIVEIVSALAMNPDNENLRRALLGTYQRQVKLLQKTIEIADDEAASSEP